MASRKTSEISKLQEEIAGEIGGDAPEIAAMVFGGPRDQPDVVTVRNERLDDVYRQAYVRNDRNWLQGEAKRDPEQFLKVADRIGVVLPPTPPGMAGSPTFGAFAKTAAQAPASPLASPPVAAPVAPITPIAPVAPVAPIVSPALPQAPPIILGPNGQPLPPSGGVGV